MTKFIIKTVNDNGTGIEHETLTGFVYEIRAMAEHALKCGAECFEVEADSDASCFEEEDGYIEL